jgi:hypothetical protein
MGDEPLADFLGPVRELGPGDVPPDPQRPGEPVQPLLCAPPLPCPTAPGTAPRPRACRPCGPGRGGRAPPGGGGPAPGPEEKDIAPALNSAASQQRVP